MSTEYKLWRDFIAVERSSKVYLAIEDGYGGQEIATADMDAAELRTVIVKLVHVLSYISDDPNEALKRFNVDYSDTE